MFKATKDRRADLMGRVSKAKAIEQLQKVFNAIPELKAAGFDVDAYRALQT